MPDRVLELMIAAKEVADYFSISQMTIYKYAAKKEKSQILRPCASGDSGGLISMAVDKLGLRKIGMQNKCGSWKNPGHE
jgi:hypothetical protein